MKLSSPSTLILLPLLIATSNAWDKDDHEIFRLKDELDRFEGPGVTFYEFLEIPRAAKQIDIDRAFRKRSRALHPDKARQTLISERRKTSGGKPPTEREVKTAEKIAGERFTRLGLIADILKDDRRRSYDHFLDNGFPAWRGTGYYYSRFRPGLFSTLIGLFVFSGGLLHYVVLILGYKQQRDFVERYIRQARQAAWGNSSAAADIPGLSNAALGTGETPADEEPLAEAVNRRERRAQDKEAKKKNNSKDKTLKPARGGNKAGSGTNTPQESGTSTPVPGARRRIEAENGKILVVDRAGNVFLEEEDEETEETNLLLLDPNEIEKPTFKGTFLYRLPVWVAGMVQDRIAGGKTGGSKANGSTPEILVDEDGVVDIAANGNSSDAIDTPTPAARQRKRKSKK